KQADHRQRHASGYCPRDSPQPEQKKRKSRRGCADAPAVPEDHVGRERPANRADERGDRRHPKVAKEKKRGKEREKQSERAGERPGERDRQKNPDPGRGMKDRRLGSRQKRSPSEDEPIPEREASVNERFPHRRAPREIRIRQIREDRIGNVVDPLLGSDSPPGLLRVIHVGRPVETPEQHRLAGEEKRPSHEKQRRPPADRTDEPPRQPERRPNGDRIGQPERGNLEVSRQFSVLSYQFDSRTRK